MESGGKEQRKGKKDAFEHGEKARNWHLT